MVISSVPVRDELETPLILLRLSDIPPTTSLSSLLKVIATASNDIIGIYRTADYTTKRLGSVVYFMCSSPRNAARIERQEFNFVDDRDAQRLTIADSIVARAVLPKNNYLEQLDRKPVPIHLTALLKHKRHENKTQYLMSLSRYFETKATVTGIQLSYNHENGSTRNDGFVYCLFQREARDIAGEIVPHQHPCGRRSIKALLSFNIPVVIRVNNVHMLTNGQADWCQEIELMNQLMISLDPQRALPDVPIVTSSTSSSIADKSKPKLASVIIKPSDPNVTANNCLKRKRLNRNRPTDTQPKQPKNDVSVADNESVLDTAMLIPRISESQITPTYVKRTYSGIGANMSVVSRFEELHDEEDRLVIDEEVQLSDIDDSVLDN